MQVIYTPTGPALEYGKLALNPWGKSFCSHDCSYCYVPGMFRMSREQWRKRPFRPRKDLIKKLRRDCEELRGTNERVHCCFVGDLYSPEAASTGISRHILKTFREFDVPFQVLTKGGMRACADFDLYGPHDAFATTLTTDGAEAWTWEPGAADPSDRIRAITTAHRKHIETWLSLEPVMDPACSLRLIESLRDIVDLYKIGKLNHDPRANGIDWRIFGIRAIDLCEKFGKPYYVKADLAKYLAGVTFTNTDTRKVVRAESQAKG